MHTVPGVWRSENGGSGFHLSCVPEFLRLIFKVLALRKVEFVDFVHELCFVKQVLFALAHDYSSDSNLHFLKLRCLARSDLFLL